MLYVSMRVSASVRCLAFVCKRLRAQMCVRVCVHMHTCAAWAKGIYLERCSMILSLDSLLACPPCSLCTFSQACVALMKPRFLPPPRPPPLSLPPTFPAPPLMLAHV
jgi:hypothetical protein